MENPEETPWFDIDYPFSPSCTEGTEEFEWERHLWETARKLMSKMSQDEQDAVHYFCVMQHLDYSEVASITAPILRLVNRRPKPTS